MSERTARLGIRATYTLRTATDAMVNSVGSALEFLANDSDQLYKIIKSMYPAYGVMCMTFKRPKSEA